MKHNRILIALMLIVLLFTLSSCNEATPTAEPTIAPTATVEATVEPTVTEEPTDEPTATVEPTIEPTATEEPTAEPTATDEPTAEPTATDEPTAEPTATDEPTAEPTATDEPTPEPTATDEPTPEPTATAKPVIEPIPVRSQRRVRFERLIKQQTQPTIEPTPEPTAEPEAEANTDRVFTIEELAQYNGSNGKPAYIAMNGIVYDVTRVPLWRGGFHKGCTAGRDVTEDVHHDMSYFEGIPVVGTMAE